MDTIAQKVEALKGEMIGDRRFFSLASRDGLVYLFYDRGYRRSNAAPRL